MFCQAVLFWYFFFAWVLLLSWVKCNWQGSGKKVEFGAFDFQPVRLGLR